MKSKILSTIVLIIASVLCVFVGGVIIFAGASFVGGILDGKLEPIGETIKEFFTLLALLLFVVSVVIAWFKQKIGGLLITIFAVAIFGLIKETELLWLQLSVLPIGPLLFFFGSSGKVLSDKGETNSLR